MVNASLNWASIVGIALAICGGGLYFLRSFKPALARDYDVFFAAIGLLCGGILFFQGWRLDPILQFGQFLLAGTTVFFAYESVRLRGIATDQARRSSYFEEEFDSPPRSSSAFRSREGEDYDRFQETEPVNRRFLGREIEDDYDSREEDFYRSRRNSRPAIPEQAASRRGRSQRDSLKSESRDSRRMSRFSNNSSSEDSNKRSTFGDRRSFRQEEKRGSRPRSNNQTTRRSNQSRDSRVNFRESERKSNSSSERYAPPKGAPIENRAEDAAFSSRESQPERRRAPNSDMSSERRRAPNSDMSSERRRSAGNPSRNTTARRTNSSSDRPRDNSSRFDD